MASATINALYDTYIRKSSPGTNYEGDDYMVLGKVGTGNQIDRILLDIPLGLCRERSSRATLYLYQVYSSYAYTNTISFGIHRIYEDWSPGSVTWAACQAIAPRREAASSGNSSGWRNFDIAGLIQDIIHNDRSYEGLMIRQLDEDVGNTRKLLNSRSRQTPLLSGRIHRRRYSGKERRHLEARTNIREKWRCLEAKHFVRKKRWGVETGNLIG